MLRRLEDGGFLTRVRAASSLAPQGRLFVCIKLLREPEGQELQSFWDSTNLKNPRIGQRRMETEVDSDDDQDVDDGIVGSVEDVPIAPETLQETTEEKALDQTEQNSPQWTPKQPLGNLLFDVIEATGTEGLSSMVGS